MKEFSRRGIIRLSSFSILAVVVLVVFCVQTKNSEEAARRELQYSHIRAMQDSANFIDRLSVELHRAMYAQTPQYMASLSASLLRDSASAKAAVSSLPLEGFELSGASRFLSQAGNYAMALSKKAAAGEEVTQEDRATLRRLSQTADTLSGELSIIEGRFLSGEISLPQLAAEGARLLEGEPGASTEKPAPESGFSGLSEAFADMPQLIYDGPFSDHILNKTPELVRQTEVITREAARSVAAEALGVTAEQVLDAGEERSALPAFLFSFEESLVAITQNGGQVLYLFNRRETGPGAVSNEQARAAALSRLSELGFRGMRETFYDIYDNIITISFAYSQDETVCYTDLIKVGVALDTGEVILLDSRGYLVNHTDRSIPAPALTAEQASAKLSPKLTVLQRKLALIPTDGQREAHCYEFLCRGGDGEEILVYINASTGAEENILRLIRRPTGVLTE